MNLTISDFEKEYQIMLVYIGNHFNFTLPLCYIDEFYFFAFIFVMKLAFCLYI